MNQTENSLNGSWGQIRVLPEFLRWYFGARPPEILHMYLRYAKAFSDASAISFMLKTLFSPWKSITDDYPDKGLNIEGILQTFFLNVTSRMIGFVVRFFAILTGVIVQIALFVGFMAYLLLWMLFPVFLAVIIPILITVS